MRKIYPDRRAAGMCLLALCPSFCAAQPWFTGPLLTPSAHVIPYRHVNLESYTYRTTHAGLYDSRWKTRSTSPLHRITELLIVQIGLPASCDISFCPQWSWNHKDRASQGTWNDLRIGWGYPLYATSATRWSSSIKLAVHLNLPCGRYQKLNPQARGTDSGGSGSWESKFGVVLSHLIHIKGPLWLSPRLLIQYTLPYPVHVTGYNTYGGDAQTQGTVFPGQTFTCLGGCELALTQNWVLSADIQYQHSNTTRFKGNSNSSHPVGGPSSELFALAPAMEYNWSARYGLIAGWWFSLAGRNTADFVSGIIAFNIYH